MPPGQYPKTTLIVPSFFMGSLKLGLGTAKIDYLDVLVPAFAQEKGEEYSRRAK